MSSVTDVSTHESFRLKALSKMSKVTILSYDL